MRAFVQKYINMLETRAVLIVGFLLSFPIILVAMFSMPEKMTIDKILYFAVSITLILYFLKPIRDYLSRLLLIVQSLWFFSLASELPYYYKDGLESLLPGCTEWATYIFNNLFGQYYGHFILWTRSFVLDEKQEFLKVYYYVFIILIMVAVMTLVGRLIEKRVNWKMFLIIGGYFIGAWFLYVEHLRLFFSIYFVGVTVYKQFNVYESVVENARGRGERTRYYNYNSAMTVGGIIMVLVLIISTVVTHYVPIESINVTMDRFIPSFGDVRSSYGSQNIGRSSTFSFSRTMYAPNGSLLGGPIMERDYSVVMRLKSDGGGLYLRGRVKNIYDGKQWKSDFDTYRNNQFIGDLHNPLPNEQVSEIVIYPESIITRTLFSPYLYYKSEYDRGDVYGNEERIAYVKDELDTEFDRYRVLYVKQEYLGLYDKLRDDLQEGYLKVPSKGLDKTTNLTLSLVEGIDDPRVKMDTLVKYLRDTYRYSLNTEEPDYDQDFVERFLFEEKIGYCTYFATSLAVMGRIADVPTRYVEGFIANDFTDNEGLYEVTANRAHAWVEAYIPGEGWITFESTPAYSVNTISGDEPDLDDFALNSDVDRDDNLDTTPDIPTEFVDPITTSEKITVEEIMTILLYLGLFIGLLYLVYSKRRRLKEDIELGTVTEKIHKRVGYMLSMASLVNVDFDLTELPKNVVERVTDRYLGMIIPPQISNMIDQSLYSLHEFSDEEFEEFEEFFNGYEASVRLQISKVAHFTHKYIFNSLYHKDYYE